VASAARTAALCAAIFIYYSLEIRRSGAVSEAVVRLLHLDQRYASRPARSAVGLGLAGISQACFAGILLSWSDLHLSLLAWWQLNPSVIIYGLLLGIGEMAFASFLGHIGVLVAIRIAPAADTVSIDQWLTISRGGWMKKYLDAMEIAPPGLFIGLVALYVCGEEIIFRAILIENLAFAGSVAAVTGATTSFMIIQFFQMPSWRSAMLPAIGALMVGILHGALFVAVPNLVPLVIAHLVFFLSSVL
jgi:hypothetical protein